MVTCQTPIESDKDRVDIQNCHDPASLPRHSTITTTAMSPVDCRISFRCARPNGSEEEDARKMEVAGSA